MMWDDEGEGLMLDASNYAQHFPDESTQPEVPAAQPVPVRQAVTPSILAALCELENEFRDILQRAQQPEPTDPAV